MDSLGVFWIFISFLAGELVEDFACVSVFSVGTVRQSRAMYFFSANLFFCWRNDVFLGDRRAARAVACSFQWGDLGKCSVRHQREVFLFVGYRLRRGGACCFQF